MKKLLLFLLLAVAAVLAWGVLRKREPPRAPFARVRRQTLVSTLSTNGRVEPFEWQVVRAETAGVVTRTDVHEGQAVAGGQVLAGMSDPALETAVEEAEARVAEARAGVLALQAGGRPPELADIENRLERARFTLQQATNDSHALERLAEKGAATRTEVQSARNKMHDAELEIDGLEKRRTALAATKPDLAAAEARLQDAEAGLKLARRRVSLNEIRAPIAGTVYDLAAHPGSYLATGAPVASVGRLDRVRVRVYVDEPELGRVAAGQPVTIRWQALPGKEWQGTVERRPVSIQALGSRQVGEVVCTIANPGRELIPGTNVDAEIRTAVVDHAVVMPREALRHDAGGDYVFLLRDVLERRGVKTGASSIALVQVTGGLAEGDLVALPTDVPLKPGERVTPAM